jgi:hypothetical protein
MSGPTNLNGGLPRTHQLTLDWKSWQNEAIPTWEDSLGFLQGICTCEYALVMNIWYSYVLGCDGTMSGPTYSNCGLPFLS